MVLVAAAARPCGSCCPTAWCASARCGSPCRGSSRRTRRPHRPAASRGHIASSFFARGSWRASRCSARSIDGLGGARLVGLALGQHRRGGAQLLDLARQRGLSRARALVAAHGVGDVGQVAHARAGNDGHLVRAVARRRPSAAGLRSTGRPSAARRGSSAWYSAVTPSSLKRLAIVPNTGILSGAASEGLAVALHLLGDVAQRVGGALAVELVDRDELGEVEHVDLLELARGAELRRHHVHRHVDQRHDRRVALADARGLDDDEVEAGAPCRRRSRRAGPG